MDVVEALIRCGGIADGSSLRAASSPKRLRSAVRRREVVRLGRNRYALPTAQAALRAAARLHGVVSHLSAAAYYGWEVRLPPELPDVAVPRGRKVSTQRRAGVNLHRLRSLDVTGPVTSPVQTVIDCARDLPFDEALTVADSALRHGAVTSAGLKEAAARVKGAGAARVRRVAAHADGRAANPFESVLRALALDCGLEVLPQEPVVFGDAVLHPDLVDRGRRLVIEADSWSFHADREAHARDCFRYNALVLAGWRVLRFTWEQVMLSPAYVRWALRSAMQGPPGPTEVPGRGHSAA